MNALSITITPATAGVRLTRAQFAAACHAVIPSIINKVNDGHAAVDGIHYTWRYIVPEGGPPDPGKTLLGRLLAIVEDVSLSAGQQHDRIRAVVAETIASHDAFIVPEGGPPDPGKTLHLRAAAAKVRNHELGLATSSVRELLDAVDALIGPEGGPPDPGVQP